MRPYEAFHAIEMIVSNSRSSFCRKGIALSSDDNQTVSEVYQQWLLLLVDLGYLPPVSLLRDGHRLWHDMCRVDVLDLNNAFAEGLHAIRMQSRKGFKALCSRISPHLFNIIKEDVEACFSGDVIAAKKLVQLFSYTSRLSLKDIDMTQQLLDDYLAVEESIPQDFDEAIVRALNRILRSWLGPFAPVEIVGQHGPGGIAERGRCSPQVKYSLMATDPLLDYSFYDTTWNFSHRALNRTSKTIFVPKSYKTFRTISMEPAALQYFQQGVASALERQIHYSLYASQKYALSVAKCQFGYLKKHIGLRDQERNRVLARRGSINRDYATIDLSAASDSVSYALVKKLFKGTWVYKYLVCTRSTHTLLPDNRIIKLSKFAPMGSSLCFPIETLVFASLCEYVTRGRGFTGDYSVYGDDIIVPTDCAEEMMRVLGLFGFRVNREKSFYQSTCWFRESCGGEYCDGYDVTPLKISRKYNSEEIDVQTDKLISLSNSCYNRGYRNLRYFFLQKLRKVNRSVYFSSTHLLADNYTNYHTSKRWNRHLQRREVKVKVTSSRYKAKDLLHQSEDIRYYHWLSKTYNRKSIIRPFESIICRPTAVVKDVWMPDPSEEFDPSSPISFPEQ